MARGVNKVILVGNCGKDPEIRYMPSGSAVTKTSIATSESWKEKSTGDKKERVEWHNITFFGKLAEIAAEYLKKGSQVYVEGQLRTNKWQDKQGNDRYTTEVIVNNMQLLGGAPASVDRAQGSAAASHQPASSQQASRPNTYADGHQHGVDEDAFDDDIPF